MKTYLLEHNGHICEPRSHKNKRGFYQEEIESILKDDNYKNYNVICIEEEVAKYGKDYDTEGITIINPRKYEKIQDYAEQFYQLRKAKGMTKEQAYAILVSDYMYFACMMLKAGDADGVVSGACHSSANTLRPSLQIIKTKFQHFL